ncbi:MAG: 3-phosphoshikimate 1-carboxyvinyltransferase [Candidatus Methylomirabilales bacterium]
MRAWKLNAAGRVGGELRVPGDKSLSHRALILGALAEGRTEIRGLLRGEDCLATLRIVRALGVPVEDDGEVLRVQGGGPGGLTEPEDVLDAGNSGTTLRLMAGVLSGRPFLSLLTGDASLRRRPMRRVAEPLRAMGATILGRGGDHAPLAVRGAALRALAWRSPVASAQVKSAILLAGLQAAGTTTVAEPVRSRDHTERMLAAFGAACRVEGTAVSLEGPAKLTGTAVAVPGDLSSAAFLLVAAAARPGAQLTVRGVGVNPTRTGLLDVLGRMGARVSLERAATSAGEPVADLHVRGARLRGTSVAPEEVPRLVDEVPILAVAAALAEGRTVVRGAGELRVKEVDRLAALAGELGALGVAVGVQGDTLVVEGGAGRPLRGARVESRGDHRMAMSLAVAGLFAEGETTVRDVACVETSFPGFARLLLQVAPDCGIREVEDGE